MPIRRHSLVLNHWQFSIRQLRQPLQPPQIFCPYFTLTSKLNLDKSSDFFAAKLLLQSSPATDDDHQRLIHWHRLRLLIGGKVAAAEASPVAEVWSLVRALFKVNRKSARSSERWMTTATGQQSFRGTFMRTFTSNLSLCVCVIRVGKVMCEEARLEIDLLRGLRQTTVLSVPSSSHCPQCSFILFCPWFT